MQAMHGRRSEIDVVNASTLVPAQDARRAVRSLKVQVREHFAPVWGTTADVRFVGRADAVRAARPGAWQLVLLDARNASYGYHDLTRDGLPLGKVFLREALKTKTGWTVTASHELLELLVDPDTTFGVLVEDRTLGPRFYSYEVCDPVQDDRFAYAIDGVPVSDFVYPAWFEPWHPARRAGRGRGGSRQRFDHAGKLRSPFEVPRGCYAMFYDVRKRVWRDNWGGNVTPHLTVPQGAHDRLEGRECRRTIGTPTDRGGSRHALHGSPRLEWRKSAVCGV